MLPLRPRGVGLPKLDALFFIDLVASFRNFAFATVDFPSPAAESRGERASFLRHVRPFVRWFRFAVNCLRAQHQQG
jgi:hypothetical protein